MTGNRKNFRSFPFFYRRFLALDVLLYASRSSADDFYPELLGAEDYFALRIHPF
jgi:hypothetical protein